MSKTVTIASCNINGLLKLFQPLPGDEALMPYALRHTAICQWFEKSNVDIINFQEVFTYRNLRLLRKHLPSYRYVAYRPFIFGPRGALVTFSRTPMVTKSFTSFLRPALSVKRTALPKGSLLRSSLKGILVTQCQKLPLTIINTHCLYNADFNWQAGGRFYGIQRAELDALTTVVNKQVADRPDDTVLLSGDLNIEVGSDLSDYFLANVPLHDLFAADTASSFHNEYLAPPGFQRRIDYLLANRKPAATQRLFTQKVRLQGHTFHLSDHQGLLATITLRN